MPKPEIEFQPAVAFAEEVTQGLSTRVLSLDPETGDKTVLLVHAPGSSWGDPVCKHEYWEEAYIIEGRLFDKTLEKWFDAGDYCCRPPGMLHGPFEADEQSGCKEICWLRYPPEVVWTPPKEHSGFSSVSRTSFNLSRHPRRQTGNPEAHGVFEHSKLPGPYNIYGAQ